MFFMVISSNNRYDQLYNAKSIWLKSGGIRGMRKLDKEGIKRLCEKCKQANTVANCLSAATAKALDGQFDEALTYLSRIRSIPDVKKKYLKQADQIEAAMHRVRSI